LSVEISAAGPTDTIQFSNVTVVRDQEGNLSVWVAGEKILGGGNIQMSNGMLAFVVPLTRVRLAEDVPATPVYEFKDNVVPFNRFSGQNAVVDEPRG
jgi:hypothetical protein